MRLHSLYPIHMSPIRTTETGHPPYSPMQPKSDPEYLETDTGHRIPVVPMPQK